MLEIIVSNPCPFGGLDFNEEDNAKIKKAFNEGHTVTSISYLHGIVEQKMGYDIGICLNVEECSKDDDLIDGIYDANIQGYDGKCKAYLWNSYDKYSRGLIVDIEDKESVEYAEKCYNNKVAVL